MTGSPGEVARSYPLAIAVEINGRPQGGGSSGGAPLFAPFPASI
jgi:hypothetical protein